jgi:acylphosphatase
MALHLVIHGLVQGVGYRESMCREAERLGVSGWVRNRRDRTVEAIIDGEPAQLDTLLEWTKRGPPSARVDRVDCTPASGRFVGFQRHPTR